MTKDFLFHKVSEKEREEIKREAKRIMDSFSQKLGKVDLKEEPIIERELCVREEDSGECHPTKYLMSIHV